MLCQYKGDPGVGYIRETKVEQRLTPGEHPREGALKRRKLDKHNELMTNGCLCT